MKQIIDFNLIFNNLYIKLKKNMKNISLFKIALLLIILVSSCDKNQESTDTVKDIDGNIYKTVVIGGQLWMKENLRTTRYSDGSSIPNIVNYDDWHSQTEGAFCWHKNDSANKKLGAIYNYYAIIDSRNVCPEGWHVPSDDEWKILEFNIGLPFQDLDKIGMRGTDQGDKLKASTGWLDSGNGNNIVGFSAFPSPIRWIKNMIEYSGTDDYGFANEIGYGASFWSPAPKMPYNYNYKSLVRILNSYENGIGRGGGEWDSLIPGYPLRCIKD